MYLLQHPIDIEIIACISSESWNENKRAKILATQVTVISAVKGQ